MFNFSSRRRPSHRQLQVAVERCEDRTLLSSVIQVDNSFGTDGRINVPQGIDAFVQDSGRIVLLKTQAIDFTHSTLVLEAYTVAGQPDTSFATNGKSKLLPPSTSVNAVGLFLVEKPDGGAYVIGRTQLANETGQRYFIASLNAEGALVGSFGYQGRLTMLPADQDVIKGAAVDASGRLLLMRHDAVNDGDYVQRLGLNGQSDASFGTSGKTQTFGLNYTDIAVGQDGTVFVTSPVDFGSFAYVIGFSGQNGGFTNFAQATFTSDPNGTPTATGAKIVVDHQGRIYVGVEGETVLTLVTGTIRKNVIAVHRYSSNLVEDTGFSFEIDTTPANTGDATRLGGMAVQANNLLLLSLNDTSVANRSQMPRIVRVKENGTLDNTFDNDGFFSPAFSGKPNASLILLPMQNGKLLTLLSMQGTTSTPPFLQFQRYFVGALPPTGRGADVYFFDPTSGKLSVSVVANGAITTQQVANLGADANWDTVTGDFDGDTLLDFAARNSLGRWKVYLAGPKTVSDWGNWNKDFAWQRVHVGDFNGDGKDDIIGQIPANAQLYFPDGTPRKTLVGGDWWVALSNGDKFVNEFFGRWQPEGWIDFEFGDFTGDGQTDVLGLLDSGAWILGISSGTHFNIRFRGKWATTPAWQEIVAGDFDGDGVDEIAGMNTQGSWYLGEFGNNLTVQTSLMTQWTNPNTSVPVMTGDFNGDGRTDLIGAANNGAWLMVQGDGTSFQTVDYFGTVPLGGSARSLIGDFNGDGLDDVMSVYLANQAVQLSTSTGIFFQQSQIGILSGFKASSILDAGEIVP